MASDSSSTSSGTAAAERGRHDCSGAAAARGGRAGRRGGPKGMKVAGASSRRARINHPFLKKSFCHRAHRGPSRGHGALRGLIEQARPDRCSVRRGVVIAGARIFPPVAMSARRIGEGRGPLGQSYWGAVGPRATPSAALLAPVRFTGGVTGSGPGPWPLRPRTTRRRPARSGRGGRLKQRT
jgi:hypothetical protein